MIEPRKTPIANRTRAFTTFLKVRFRTCAAFAGVEYIQVKAAKCAISSTQGSLFELAIVFGCLI